MPSTSWTFAATDELSLPCSLGELLTIASPEAGKPMTAKVDRIGSRVRSAAAATAAALCVDVSALREAMAPRIAGLGFNLDEKDVAIRAAWWLVGQWLVGFALGAVPRSSSLRDSETWFYGAAADKLPAFAPPISMRAVCRNVTRREVWALLPYILDPLAPGTRRHLLASQEQARDRASRKEGGVFYTPADVAHWMAGRAAPGTRRWTAFDPACGSGVFLRAALLRHPAAATVFGTDIEPAAAEMAAFVLMALEKDWWLDAPWCGWQLLRMRLATVDAMELQPGTELSDVEQARRRGAAREAEAELQRLEVPPAAHGNDVHTSLGALFPALADGADLLLTNPPYARLGSDPRRLMLARRFASFCDSPPSAAKNMYTAFVEMAWRLTREGSGNASLVVPLSIAFHSGRQYTALRSAMERQPGGWDCAFFDRAPDALFGDDVKTRNAVITYRASGSGLRVSGILRWTSRTRRVFLDGVQSVEVAPTFAMGIPKVGTAAEAALYRALRAQPGRFAHDVVRSALVPATTEMASIWTDSVFVASTAYNWFNCVRDIGSCAFAGHESAAGFAAFQFSHRILADAAYAVLISRLALWLWRVEGDAFHTSRSFFLGFPIRLTAVSNRNLEQLAQLGRAAWARISDRPVVAVNRGRRTVAFPPTAATDLVSEIDYALADGLGLSDEVSAVDLPAWYRMLVVVDDGDTRRNRMTRLQAV